MQHVMPVRENVSGIMENGETQVLLHPRQRWRRKSEFQVVDEQGSATEWKSRNWIARPRLIQPEAAMRVSAAREKPLRQRNRIVSIWNYVSWLHDDRRRKRNLKANSRGPREHKLSVGWTVLTEQVIRGVLHQEPSKVSL